MNPGTLDPEPAPLSFMSLLPGRNEGLRAAANLPGGPQRKTGRASGPPPSTDCVLEGKNVPAPLCSPLMAVLVPSDNTCQNTGAVIHQGNVPCGFRGHGHGA